MDLLNLVLGLFVLILGVVVFIFIYNTQNNSMFDKHGDNLKVYTGSLIFIFVGLVLIIKELLKL